MRRVRNPLGNKENVTSDPRDKQSTSEIDSLRMELKNAQIQIASLHEKTMRLQQTLDQKVINNKFRKVKSMSTMSSSNNRPTGLRRDSSWRSNKLLPRNSLIT